MKITEVPEDVLFRWKEKGYTAANHCFANCSRLVFQTPAMGLGYVLCWIDINGQRYPHAVISHRDNYFDPTLQRSNLECSYDFVKQYSRTELISAIVNGGGQYDEARGTIEGFPPSLLEDGTIACVGVDAPRPRA